MGLVYLYPEIPASYTLSCVHKEKGRKTSVTCFLLYVESREKGNESRRETVREEEVDQAEGCVVGEDKRG
jgi:hypothetical protein